MGLEVWDVSPPVLYIYVEVGVKDASSHGVSDGSIPISWGGEG